MPARSSWVRFGDVNRAFQPREIARPDTRLYTRRKQPHTRPIDETAWLIIVNDNYKTIRAVAGDVAVGEAYGVVPSPLGVEFLGLTERGGDESDARPL